MLKVEYIKIVIKLARISRKLEGESMMKKRFRVSRARSHIFLG